MLKSQGVFMRPSRGGRHYNMCEDRRHDSIHLCAHSNNMYNIHLHPCVYTHIHIGNTYEHRLEAQHVTFEIHMAELGCWPGQHIQMVSGPG